MRATRLYLRADPDVHTRFRQPAGPGPGRQNYTTAVLVALLSVALGASLTYIVVTLSEVFRQLIFIHALLVQAPTGVM